MTFRSHLSSKTHCVPGHHCCCLRNGFVVADMLHCQFIRHCIFWDIIIDLVAICVRVAYLCMLASALWCYVSVFQDWARAGSSDFDWSCCEGQLWGQKEGASYSKTGGQKKTCFDLCFWFVVSTVVWKDALALATDDTTIFAFSDRPIDRETSWHVCFRSEGNSAPFDSMFGRCNILRCGHSQYLESRGFNSQHTHLHLLSPPLPEVFPDPACLWPVAPLPATIAQCSVHSSRHVLSHSCRGAKYDTNICFSHGSRSHFVANSCT